MRARLGVNIYPNGVIINVVCQTLYTFTAFYARNKFFCKITESLRHKLLFSNPYIFTMYEVF